MLIQKDLLLFVPKTSRAFLDALGARFVFHINVKQDLIKFLNGLLDLSFFCITITCVFPLPQNKVLVLDRIIVFEIDSKP